jgi:hypothetical protein
MRLPMFLERRWFYGDVLFIIDPWLRLSLARCRRGAASPAAARIARQAAPSTCSR